MGFSKGNTAIHKKKKVEGEKKGAGSTEPLPFPPSVQLSAAAAKARHFGGPCSQRPLSPFDPCWMEYYSEETIQTADGRESSPSGKFIEKKKK